MYTPDRQITPDDDNEELCPECNGRGKISECCDAPVTTYNSLFLACDSCLERTKLAYMKYCRTCEGCGSVDPEDHEYIRSDED